MPAVAVLRRALPAGSAAVLRPLELLRLLGPDRHPFALIGNWASARAGGSAILGSEPVTVCRPPDHLEQVMAPLPPASGPARFGGGWIGYLGYGLARHLHALPSAPGGP